MAHKSIAVAERILEDAGYSLYDSVVGKPFLCVYKDDPNQRVYLEIHPNETSMTATIVVVGWIKSEEYDIIVERFNNLQFNFVTGKITRQAMKIEPVIGTKQDDSVLIFD